MRAFLGPAACPLLAPVVTVAGVVGFVAAASASPSARNSLELGVGKLVALLLGERNYLLGRLAALELRLHCRVQFLGVPVAA